MLMTRVKMKQPPNSYYAQKKGSLLAPQIKFSTGPESFTAAAAAAAEKPEKP